MMALSYMKSNYVHNFILLVLLTWPQAFPGDVPDKATMYGTTNLVYLNNLFGEFVYRWRTKYSDQSSKEVRAKLCGGRDDEGRTTSFENFTF